MTTSLPSRTDEQSKRLTEVILKGDEVERYSTEQVSSCERAAEKALDALRPRLKLEPRRISGRVMVASLKGDPHAFDKTLLLTMLEVGGITALDGGEELSPADLTTKVSTIKPDVLAISLLTSLAAKGLIETRSRLESSGTMTRIVVYGRGTGSLPEDSGTVAREEDSLSALSKIAEILLAL